MLKFKQMVVQIDSQDLLQEERFRLSRLQRHFVYILTATNVRRLHREVSSVQTHNPKRIRFRRIL